MTGHCEHVASIPTTMAEPILLQCTKILAAIWFLMHCWAHDSKETSPSPDEETKAVIRNPGRKPQGWDKTQHKAPGPLQGAKAKVRYLTSNPDP
jgi:hypothetical protein